MIACEIGSKSLMSQLQTTKICAINHVSVFSLSKKTKKEFDNSCKGHENGRSSFFNKGDKMRHGSTTMIKHYKSNNSIRNGMRYGKYDMKIYVTNPAQLLLEAIIKMKIVMTSEMQTIVIHAEMFKMLLIMIKTKTVQKIRGKILHQNLR